MAKFNLFSRVEVSGSGFQYPVIIGKHGLDDFSLLQSLVPGFQVLIVTNTTVAPIYLESVLQAFAAKQCDVVFLQDGEAYKTQQSLFTIYDALIKKRHHRQSCLVALGGGVVGDITGFAASTYQRGVPYIQIPTTLLAQIDASVGGKTAINHPLGKNMIGSFYQPQAVLIDIETLNTLPEREFRAGLAEMIKYALLVGGTFLQQLQKALQQGITAQSTELPELIAACCRIKAAIVTEDEKETGSRALLNLGHTFAHALEAITQYQEWLHGEAVAIGLYCAVLMSHDLGHVDEKAVHLVEDLLQQAGLAYKIPRSIDLTQLIELMAVDKKIKGNNLRFVLFRGLGDCYLEDQVRQTCLQKTLLNALEGE